MHDVIEIIEAGLQDVRGLSDEQQAAVLLDRLQAAGIVLLSRVDATEQLVGAAEVAERTGVSRSQVWNWRKRRANAPEPLVHLKGTPVWIWADWLPFLRERNAA